MVKAGDTGVKHPLEKIVLIVDEGPGEKDCWMSRYTEECRREDGSDMDDAGVEYALLKLDAEDAVSINGAPLQNVSSSSLWPKGEKSGFIVDGV